MKLKLSSITILLMVFALQLSFAQEKIISGNISDEYGLPLAGATVLVKDSSNGASSDFDGNYSITANVGATLVFSFVGYKTHEEIVDSSDTINVTLIQDSESLDEIVVVAYGEQSKQSIVGAVAVISDEILETQQITSPLGALQGVVPGVNIVNSGGQPGTNPSIRIRGTASINLSAEPLIIVDGAPFNGNINSISQDQIESRTILKDASASALYGSRAANGVIIITTKKGKLNQAPKVSVRSQLGASNPTVGLHDLLGAEDYLKSTWQAIKNTYQYEYGESASFSAQNATNRLIDRLGYNPYNVNNPIDTNGNLIDGAQLLWETNWEDEIIANNYARSNHNVNISGGGNNSTYFLSLDYLNEEGPVTPSDFERFTSRLNLTSKVKDWLNVGMNMSFSRSTSNNPDQTSGSQTQAINWIYGVSSIYPIYARDENGNIILNNVGNTFFDTGNGNGRPIGQAINSNRPSASGDNIIASLKLGKEERTQTNYFSNAFAEVNLVKNLKFKSSLSYENYLFDSYSFSDDQFGASSNIDLGDGKTAKGRITESSSLITTLNAIQSLQYNSSYLKHNFNASFITEYYTRTNKVLSASGIDFLPDVENLNSATLPESVGGNTISERLNSFLGKVGYDYNKTYYTEFSLRTDGSSRFAKDNRWGTFYSVGAGWIISNELFLKDNKTINYLKQRLSFGELGNNLTKDFFPYQAPFVTGFSNEENPGLLPDGIADKDLRWEKLQSLNIGIDFELFNSRLSGTIDYYNKETFNLILDRPVAPSLGVTNILTNVGSLQNYGWEFSLSSVNINSENFNWTTGINFSLDKNQWTQTPEERSISGTKLWEVGNSIYDFYLPEWAGVDPADGRGMWFVDLVDSNGNVVDKTTTKVYSQATRYETGKSSLPDIQGGFTSFFKYKQFDLSVLFNFSFGAYLLDTDYASLMNPFSSPGSSAHPDNLNAWQQPGDITDVPLLLTSSNDHASTSTRFLFKNDYIRLRSLNFGYNLPEKLIDRIHLSKFRVFVQADNFWTWQSHKGIDPEQSFGGVTGNQSPLSKTITSGVIIEF